MLSSEAFERLCSLDPGPFPVLSLYLNAQPNQVGRDQFELFLRKELDARVRTYSAGSPERASLEQDAEKIRHFLDVELQASANGVAIFSCSGVGFFEPIQFSAPIERHELYVGERPQLYPLARLNDQYPRYAALVADTHVARLFVFGGAELLEQRELRRPKTQRPSGGGWSQARYQRHVDEYHRQHVKEVIEVLGRVVRIERIEHIVLAGDEVIVPMIRAELPRDLADRVVDVLRLDITTAAHDVLHATIEAVRRQDAKTDRDKVEAVVGMYRAGGLAVVGVRETMAALANGQVDELLISATPAVIRPDLSDSDTVSDESTDQAAAALAGQLVALAHETNARTSFIEDSTLLAGFGGVAASLRYR